MRPGDKLLTVNGESVLGYTVEQVNKVFPVSFLMSEGKMMSNDVFSVLGELSPEDIQRSSEAHLLVSPVHQ